MKKNVSVMTVMFLVLGNIIGSGIFFKNQTILSNTGSIVFSVVAWIIAIFAVFCICMCLGDIIKKTGYDNALGYVGWMKSICGTNIYKGFRNFMFWFYIPASIVLLAYYAVMSLQDSLSVYFRDKCVLPWWSVALICLVIFAYFQYMATINKKVSLVQNYWLTFAKFIPILFAIFGGIFFFAYTGEAQNTVLNNSAPFSLTAFSPQTFGVIASIPAIFFAFDGFYNAGAVYGDMKEPKKFSMALSLGVALTGVIYLLISIGMLLGAPGGAITGWFDILTSGPGKVLLFIILFLIFVAIVAIVNGLAIYADVFCYDVIKNDNNKFNAWLKKKVNIDDAKKFALTLLIFESIIFVVFTAIGAFYYRGVYQGVYYDNTTSGIYSFCDLAGNWTSLLVFFGIGLTILFGLIKKVYESKKNVAFGIIAVSLVFLGTFYQVADSLTDLIAAIVFQTQHSGTDPSEYLIPSILKFATLVALTLVCFGPSIKAKCLPIRNLLSLRK